MKSNKRTLEKLRWNFGFSEKQHCEPAEQETLAALHKNHQPLPWDIHMDESGFFRYVDAGTLNAEERREYMTLKQLYYLRSIRNAGLLLSGLAALALIVFLVLL